MEHLEDRIWTSIAPAIRAMAGQAAAARRRTRRLQLAGSAVALVILLAGATLLWRRQPGQVSQPELRSHLQHAQVALTEWLHSPVPLGDGDRREALLLNQENARLLASRAGYGHRAVLQRLSTVLWQVSTGPRQLNGNARSVLVELQLSQEQPQMGQVKPTL